MTDYSELSFEMLCERLAEPASTLILLHRNPDADAVGSAFALKELLLALGSHAWCVCADELPARLRFLADAEQESLLPEAIPEGVAIERIVSVDSASPAQLGDLYTLYGESIELMIDHHGMGEVYADHYVRDDAAATGEILFDLVRCFAEDGRIRITKSLCERIYAAISSDTGCFQFSNVTSGTHNRAADLIASGIDCAEINRLLFHTVSYDQLRAQAAGISNLHLHADGKIGVMLFPYALKAALGLSDEHLGNLVDVVRSLEGVKVAVFIRQPKPEGVFRVSTRSACDFDVAALCAKFDGGGHKKAAGCTLEADSAEAAMEKLLAEIDPALIF